MKTDTRYELVVVGGGPAGMAAAAAARQAGLERILVAERNETLGGVLPQCIHEGFGVSENGGFLTGPEYANAWENRLRGLGIEKRTGTAVLQIDGEGPYAVKLTGPQCGLATIQTESVVIAAGCRERTLGQLRIPGGRPAGIYTAGAAQYMMNVKNYLPGKSVVILGSGDIGLIMARRLTLEGARVKLILGERACGLLRNYITCVREFGLPIRFGYTVVSTHGYRRLKGVTVAPVDETGALALERKEYVPCDTLLVAAGLIPEAELWAPLGPLAENRGIPADGAGATMRAGIFACGNVVRVYDTVDAVAKSGQRAGHAAAEWVLRGGHPSGGEPAAPPPAEVDGSAEDPRPTGADLDLLFATGGGQGDRELMVCTLCPRSCRLEVAGRETGVGAKGNRCPKGAGFAAREQRAPERTVTTTVRRAGGVGPLLPVKTDRPVPKQAVLAVVKACGRVTAEADAAIGDILVENIAGTGANLVAAGAPAKPDGWDGPCRQGRP